MGVAGNSGLKEVNTGRTSKKVIVRGLSKG